MRVLLLIDSLDTGGAENALVPLARHMDRSRVELYAVGIFGLEAKHRVPSHRIVDEFQDLGIPFTHLDAHSLRDVTAFRELMKLIKAERIDLIHSHLAFGIMWGALASELAHIPLVVTLHSYGAPPKGVREKTWAALSGLAARRAAKVVCVCDAQRMEQLQSGDVNPTRLVTVYNGIDLDRFTFRDETRARLRREFGVSDGSPVVTMVALLRHVKGHDELVKAIPRVLGRFPQARFVLAGGGDREAELRAAVQEFGDSVLFLGMRDDVPDILSASDLFVLPSYSEALPTVLLEAMAMRLPVVATRVGGTPEIVADGETGLLIPTHDADALARAILDCLEDPARARAMGDAGRERVEEVFSAPRFAQSLARLYEESTAGRQVQTPGRFSGLEKADHA